MEETTIHSPLNRNNLRGRVHKPQDNRQKMSLSVVAQRIRMLCALGRKKMTGLRIRASVRTVRGGLGLTGRGRGRGLGEHGSEGGNLVGRTTQLVHLGNFGVTVVGGVLLASRGALGFSRQLPRGIGRRQLYHMVLRCNGPLFPWSSAPLVLRYSARVPVFDSARGRGSHLEEGTGEGTGEGHNLVVESQLRGLAPAVDTCCPQLSQCV